MDIVFPASFTGPVLLPKKHCHETISFGFDINATDPLPPLYDENARNPFVRN
jgi:hypothetical protein